MVNAKMAQQMERRTGFHRGASTSPGLNHPKALGSTAVKKRFPTDEEIVRGQITACVPAIIRSPASPAKVIGAILFSKRNMDGEVAGISTADYLWDSGHPCRF